MKKAKKTEGVSALARSLGVSRQLVSKHAKKPGVPALSDVDGWRVFLASMGRDNSGEPDIRRKIALKKLAILEQVERKAKRENQIADKESAPFSEVRKTALAVLSFLCGELDRLRQTLPPLLKGRTELEIVTEWDRQTASIKPELRQLLEGMTE